MTIWDRGRAGAGAARSLARRIAGGPQHAAVANHFPLGHYYSPVPDDRVLRTEPRRSQVWPAVPRQTPGIDWRDESQLALCRTVLAAQERLDFAPDESADPTVFFTGNDQYPPLDAWILEGLLRHVAPARMIEIGSGFSSLVTARVNREYLDGAMEFTCVEPMPRQFLVDGVPGLTRLIPQEVQDVPLSTYDALGDGDVLFIDTSHTVKTGGDVPWIYNQILPRLHTGVLVHLHDVFLPGDYPQPWVSEGWGWNEVYLVNSFLVFNSGYEVVFGAQWMLQHHRDEVMRAVPAFREHEARSGVALWIRRTGGRPL
jgi:hypothetical protein